MLVELFVFGRPGSGKSVAARVMADLAEKKGWRVTRFKDYDILHEWYRDEVVRVGTGIIPRKFRPIEFGGFDVVEFSVLREATEALLEKIRIHLKTVSSEMSHAREIMIIEFARNDYNEDLNLFLSQFDGYASVLFIDANVQSCFERVNYRARHPHSSDDHYVSEGALKGYYREQHTTINNRAIEVKIISNEETLEAFEQKIRHYIEGLLSLKDLL